MSDEAPEPDAQASAPDAPAPEPDAPLTLEELGPSDAAADVSDDQETKSAMDLAPVFDVPVNISAVLGRAQMSVAELLKLAQGSVLELDRKVGEAIDIYVNNRLVARGEVVLVDERLGVTMTEIIKDGDAVL
jgi:flagellar motor switch protein FliN/FliY